MEHDIILGQVERTWMHYDSLIALLMPLYRLNPDSGNWVQLTDPEREFPNRGHVSWYKAPEEAVEGTLWTFSYDFFPTFDETDTRSDRYRIDWHKPPEHTSEILELNASNQIDILRWLDRGLQLPFIPSRYVYIAVDKETWAGPIKLVHDNGRWFIESRIREHPISCFRALPDHSIAPVYIDGKRRLLRYGEQPQHNIGDLDWSPDKLLVKRLLKTANKYSDLSRIIVMTKAAIKEAVDKLPGSEQALSPQQLERALAYIADIERFSKDLQHFEAELLALQSVQKRIEAVEQKARDTALNEIHAELTRLGEEQARLTSECETRRQELVTVEREIANVEEQAKQQAAAAAATEQKRLCLEIQHLEEQLAERRRQYEQPVELADALIKERIAALVRAPEQALAHIALVRAALGPSVPTVTTTPAATNGGVPPSAGWSASVLPPAMLRSAAETVDDQKQLVKLLKQSVQSAGLVPSLGALLHAALVSGLMPLVSGPAALEAFEQHASVAVNRRLLWVPVSPTMLEPADLLGKADPRTGQLMPHPAGLLDVLLFANQPEQQDRLFLVVLDGINRAAADAYLLPLLTCYRSAWSDDLNATLSIAHPSMLSPDSPYAPVARIRWPPNVLLAGTLIEGSATVPLPPAIWLDAVHFEASYSNLSASHPMNGTTKLTDTSFHAWSSWHAQAHAQVAGCYAQLGDMFGAEVLRSIATSQTFARFLAAYQMWAKDTDAVRAAVQASLIPYAVATHQLEALTEALNAAELPWSQAYVTSIQQVLA